MGPSNKETQAKNTWRLKGFFPDISESSENKLRLFQSTIEEFNKALALVSEKTLPFVDVIHVADSLLASREILKDAKPSSLCDIGTGNGFPGIIFAILYPEVKVTIIDTVGGKQAFIKGLVTKLDLKNVTYQETPIENVPAGSIEFAVMRGLLSIPKATLLLRKQIKKNGALFMMKGEEWPNEVANIPIQLCSLWYPSLVADYRLPIGESKLSVVKLKKTGD